MLQALLLALLPQQSPAAPAPAAPAATPLRPLLAHVQRDAELVVLARVLALESRALETVEGKPVRMARGVKETRLAALEIERTLCGEAPAKKLWLLAQRDRADYDLELDAAGGEVLLFLSLGDDPTPEGCTYLAGTQEPIWRCADGKAGFVALSGEGATRVGRLPGFGFEKEDGELAALPRAADGRVESVPLAALVARILALAQAQRATWIEAAARSGRDGFPWKLVLRGDRSATLTIERVQGPETHEIRFSAPVMDDLAGRVAALALPRREQLVLGSARPGGLERTLAVAGQPKLELLTIEREWIEEEEGHRTLARTVLPLWSSLRAGLREPGLLDGRIDDRRWWLR